MDKERWSVYVNPETKKKCIQLAAEDGKGIGDYVDDLIEKQWRKRIPVVGQAKAESIFVAGDEKLEIHSKLGKQIAKDGGLDVK
jgi:hypothetical protein